MGVTSTPPWIYHLATTGRHSTALALLPWPPPSRTPPQRICQPRCRHGGDAGPAVGALGRGVEESIAADGGSSFSSLLASSNSSSPPLSNSPGVGAMTLYLEYTITRPRAASVRLCRPRYRREGSRFGKGERQGQVGPTFLIKLDDWIATYMPRETETTLYWAKGVIHPVWKVEGCKMSGIRVEGVIRTFVVVEGGKSDLTHLNIFELSPLHVFTHFNSNRLYASLPIDLDNMRLCQSTWTMWINTTYNISMFCHQLGYYRTINLTPLTQAKRKWKRENQQIDL